MDTEILSSKSEHAQTVADAVRIVLAKLKDLRRPQNALGDTELLDALMFLQHHNQRIFESMLRKFYHHAVLKKNLNAAVTVRFVLLQGATMAGDDVSSLMEDHSFLHAMAWAKMMSPGLYASIKTQLKGKVAHNDLERAVKSHAEPNQPRRRAGTHIAIDASYHDLAYQAKAAWVAVNKHNGGKPSIFRYAGALVRVLDKEDSNRRVQPLSEKELRGILARVIDWYWGDSHSSAYPPNEVVSDMLAHPDPAVPELTMVVSAPTFTSSGQLAQNPGYHAHSGIYYVGADPIARVSTRPSREDIAAARHLLTEELLGDFLFVDQASLANTMALLILPFVRPMVDGATPLHIIDAMSGPGTGKTLLVDIISLVVSGMPAAVLSEGRDDDEWRKRITAKLLTSSQMLVIDNVRRELKSGALAAALTASIWEDRILGHSRVANVPVTCAWAATGNGVKTSNEIARRSVLVHLDAKLEQPWLRNGFKHTDLRAWVKENRGALVHAALTLVQSWIASGQPMGNQTLGMYENWARVVLTSTAVEPNRRPKAALAGTLVPEKRVFAQNVVPM